jgi:hypothetical protein
MAVCLSVLGRRELKGVYGCVLFRKKENTRFVTLKKIEPVFPCSITHDPWIIPAPTFFDPVFLLKFGPGPYATVFLLFCMVFFAVCTIKRAFYALPCLNFFTKLQINFHGFLVFSLVFFMIFLYDKI